MPVAMSVFFLYVACALGTRLVEVLRYVVRIIRASYDVVHYMLTGVSYYRKDVKNVKFLVA